MFKTEKDFANYINLLGGTLYLVGGAVRDDIRGFKISDKDYVVEGLTELPFKQVGKDFPVYLVEIGDETVEVALCRRERKTGVGYNGFTCEVEGVTIEEDLFRRDFTMNAIAKNVLTGELIDPYDGKDSIDRRVIHIVSNEHFMEDPVRVLRCARFAAKFDFDVSIGTRILIKANLNVLSELTPERIYIELEKVFNIAPKGRRSFFDMLDDLCVLGVLFPEIKALQVPDKHDGTSYNHTMKLLEHADDFKMFMGLLTHDFGKGVTPPENHPSHHGHDKLGVPVVTKFCERLKMPNEISRFCVAGCETHMKIKVFSHMRPGKQLKLYMKYADIIYELVDLSYIDSLWRETDQDMPDFLTNHILQFEEIKKKLLQVETVYSVIDGKLLKRLGVQEGPNFGARLLEERINALKKTGLW